MEGHSNSLAVHGEGSAEVGTADKRDIVPQGRTVFDLAVREPLFLKELKRRKRVALTDQSPVV